MQQSSFSIQLAVAIILSLITHLAWPFDLANLTTKPYLDPEKLDAIYSKQMAQQQTQWHIPGHFFASIGMGSSWNDRTINRPTAHIHAKANLPNKIDTQIRAGYQVNPLLTLEVGRDWIHAYHLNTVEPGAAALLKSGFNNHKKSLASIDHIHMTHFALRVDSAELNEEKNDLWIAVGCAWITQKYTHTHPLQPAQGTSQQTTGYLALGYTSPINKHVGIDSNLTTTISQENIGAYFLLSIGLVIKV
jgi:hypothetical protein